MPIFRRAMSQATSFASVAHQLSLSLGVAVAALTLETEQTLRGNDSILVTDFVVAFLVVGLIGAMSAIVFWRLPPDAGAELTRKADASPGASDPAATANPSSVPG